MTTTLIAVWTSRGGAHHFYLTRDDSGVGYESTGGMGYLGQMTDAQAIEAVTANGQWSRVNCSQPDANKTPMIRVTVPATAQEGR
jgi:hypothetical protein